ncbi:MAG TPA: tetratricopeptide repeat protein [Methylophilaceae bacterium]|jgi:tetratricopeptide (TPR) repeat protein
MNNKLRQFRSLALAAILAAGLTSCSVNDILPNAEFNTLMVDADAAIHDGRWDVAIDKLEQAARLQPDNLEVRLKRGRALQKSGKLALAHNAYQQIIDSGEKASGRDREIIQTARRYQAELGFRPLDKAEIVEVPAEIEAALAAGEETTVEVSAIDAASIIDAQELSSSTQSSATEIDEDAALRSRVNAWRQAWAEKRIDDYFDFYATGFTGGFDSHDAWRKQRRERINAARDLRIEISDMDVQRPDDERATVSFTQRYRTATYRDEGRKTLQLRKIDNEWRITDEQFLKQ